MNHVFICNYSSAFSKYSFFIGEVSKRTERKTSLLHKSCLLTYTYFCKLYVLLLIKKFSFFKNKNGDK